MKKNSQVPKYYYFKAPKYQLAKTIRWVGIEETFSFPLISRLSPTPHAPPLKPNPWATKGTLGKPSPNYMKVFEFKFKYTRG
jgi:hypothetical protein